MNAVTAIRRHVPFAAIVDYMRWRRMPIDGEQANDQAISEAMDSLDRPLADQLRRDFERVAAMADEAGQAAMGSLPEWRERLDAIEGAHHRSLWLLCQSESSFCRAEEVRYADENQHALRLWDGFIGPKHAAFSAGPDAVNRLADAIRPLLGGGRIHIDVFDRDRGTDGGPAHSVHQITIYSEGVPVDETVFADVGVTSATRRPVIETVIVFDPAERAIEVVARTKEARGSLAVHFAREILGAEITGEKLPPRRVDLLPLLERRSLPVDPGDGINRVKLTQLTLSTSDDALIQKFKVPFKDEESFYEIMEEEFGEDSPLANGSRPWRARIEVQFEPDQDRPRGKKLNIDLCHPSKCNVRGKAERDRAVLNRYLRKWKLLEGAGI